MPDDSKQTYSPRRNSKDESKTEGSHRVQQFFRRIFKGHEEEKEKEEPVEEEVKKDKFKYDKQAKPDPELAKQVILRGEGLRGGVVGKPMQFVVVPPPDARRARYEFDSAGCGVPDIQKSYLKDKSISMTLTFPEKGNCYLAVYMGTRQCPIQGSPFKFRIYADEQELADALAEEELRKQEAQNEDEIIYTEATTAKPSNEVGSTSGATTAQSSTNIG